MNLVSLEGVSKQYSERLLLQTANMRINAGDRIGLIGINGSGKSTLLRLIAGLEQPDEGQLTVWGGVHIEYLPQDPHLEGELSVLDYLFAGHSAQLRLLRDYQEASLQLQREPTSTYWQEQLVQSTAELDRTGSWSAEANAKAILTRLGINDFAARLNTLSGGQGKRVALARVLIDRADLLILDEPTNHVDADTIAWLEEYLTTVPRALLMVTHDRYFLGRVVNRIVELDRRELVSYPGNYQRYLELRTRRDETLVTAEQKRQNLLRRELEWLRRGAMARSTKQKARKQRIQEVQQIRYDRSDERVVMALASRRLGKKVLEAQGLSKAYGDLKLFKQVNFDLVPGDRIGIIGPNGVGKSTLLDVLAGLVNPDAGTVTWGSTTQLGYYDQLSRGLDESSRVIDFINDKAPLIRTEGDHRVEAAQMLEWFLFPRPQQQKYIGSLSGGERRRLYLLWVLVHQPNVLFLDEPTNDLDIQTLNVLEQFLDHFRGCLVVVSHDRYFLDRNVDFLAAFENGTLSSRYPAPYSNYQRLRAERQTEVSPTMLAAQKKKQLPSKQSTRSGPRKLTWKETRELEALEDQIATLEAGKIQLEQSINQTGGDYQSLQALANQLQTLEEELEEKMGRWLELSEIGQPDGH
jgi:ATP-binding cassette subfamily F protein uup